MASRLRSSARQKELVSRPTGQALQLAMTQYVYLGPEAAYTVTFTTPAGKGGNAYADTFEKIAKSVRLVPKS